MGDRKQLYHDIHLFVAYYRVSTQRQGKSGLGIEAQKQAVSDYVAGFGKKGKIIKEFTEQETGKGSNALEKRPVLREAIDYTQQNNAKLVIAKLDRLARNVHFITTLMEKQVPFVCADMPEANELTIHLLAAVAQYERKLISQRTKDALAAAKKRGVKLGNPKINELNQTRQTEADENALDLKDLITLYLDNGYSQRRIVEEFNKHQIPTPRGGKWYLKSLQNVINRLRELNEITT